MANERRLVWTDDVMSFLCKRCNEMYPDEPCEPCECLMIEELDKCPTVDAVEVDDMRAFAKDVAYQFGYYCQNKGRLHITHGGLSTLEEAFDILGWDNPHPVPECECEITGCHEHATCGMPTKDGYKRMCSKHCLERREGE